ncbi:DUF4153 domain-containing protein [Nocardioides aurantiacus]|uniref:Signal transduction histidine-protein kinase/phosphatase MprB n=1 Tax=Nocardioides aurantiacus TaxID=86796 RepID=A0A3N2CUL6_9ACTN|nr:DUF4153 domain-containing protein [Nocardioides aurantiacus]ROR91211.1 signal transduction histidine kinase [Nocardioides aurantiacus]
MSRGGSIKLKLGLVVVGSVLVAAVLATLGAGSVPAWLSIPVTVALALGVSQLLAAGMTSPLRAMTEAAGRMAAGDYTARVGSTATDEVGRLARAFDAMAGDLATLDRQRRDLVASVSHELRTPLTALVAVLENLADGVVDPDPRTVRGALRQAERLSDLVTDLLDLSRVDAGVAPLRRETLAWRPLLDEAVAGAGTASLAASRGVRFDVVVEPPDLTAHVDPRRLHQLLTNLLDNAARHSPAGGAVRVHATARPGGVRLEVSDRGPGIAAQDRDRVFERFGTVAGDATGGTGLGLAIARWVTDLHGGRIAVVDPEPGGSVGSGPSGPPDPVGARFRVDLPTDLPAPRRPVERTSVMPAPTPSAPVPHPPAPRPPGPVAGAPVVGAPAPAVPGGGPGGGSGGSVADEVFGELWRDRGVPGRSGVLLAGLGVGLLAAVSMPLAAVGIGATLVLLASGLLVLRVAPPGRDAFRWGCALLCVGFALVLVVRDALWVGTLGLLVAVVLVTAACVDARSVRGLLLGVVAWPLAGLRGLPWLGRCVRTLSGAGQGLALARTAVLSLAGVLVFGLLFASADAVFSSWFDALVPDLGGNLVLRIFTGVAVAGIVLAAAYLGLNPPRVEPVGPAHRRPVARRWEWLAPVLLVDAVFLAFLAAQAAAVLGGHDFVQRTTGLTYAEYVHQGFAQLTVATALTLVVVALAARKAPLLDRADRTWLRASTGALCVLTLVVVASALQRMSLYTDAYGLTRLRLVVVVFEVWLGLVVLGVLVAGLRLRGAWLPRAAVLTGAALLLGLAVANPDAVVARTNLDRYDATGKVDDRYLLGLSDDAVPVLLDRRPELLRCDADAGARWEDDAADVSVWSAWNLGRARADLARLDLDSRAVGACPVGSTSIP